MVLPNKAYAVPDIEAREPGGRAMSEPGGPSYARHLILERPGEPLQPVYRQTVDVLGLAQKRAAVHGPLVDVAATSANVAQDVVFAGERRARSGLH